MKKVMSPKIFCDQGRFQTSVVAPVYGLLTALMLVRVYAASATQNIRKNIGLCDHYWPQVSCQACCWVVVLCSGIQVNMTLI